MDSWRLLPFRKAGAAENMAIDEALFLEATARCSPPTLRLYGWLQPAISLGRFQGGRQEVNGDACRRLGIEVVRRHTGGKAVLHDDEVTYAVAAGGDASPFPPEILGTYRLISTCIARGLKTVGIDAQLSATGRPPAAESPGVCFARPSRYELLAGGRKLCGSAQRRSGAAFLQHGSLLLAFDAQKTAALLTPDGAGLDRIGKLRQAVTSVGELAPGVTVEALCEALVEGFREVLGVAFAAGALTPAEEALKDTLLRDKYRQDCWNWEGRTA